LYPGEVRNAKLHRGLNRPEKAKKRKKPLHRLASSKARTERERAFDDFQGKERGGMCGKKRVLGKK